MALETFKCENCGARIPPPSTAVKMVVCEFCRNPGLNPFYVEPAHPVAHAAPVPPVAHYTPSHPVAHAAPGAPVPQPPPQPVPQPPPAAAAPVASVRPRGADEIARLALAHLQVCDALYYAPNIPPKKEQGARASYGAMIPAGEPILALFDATLFGGADDGFVITPNRLGWKNIALDPKVVPWDAFDARTVSAAEDEVKVMGDMIQIESSSPLHARLVSFLRAMGGAPAQAQPARPQPAPAAAAPTAAKTPKAPAAAPAATAETEEEDEEEGYDAETVQSWIDDTLGMAQECLSARDTLFFAPDIPPGKERAVRRTFGDLLEEDDTVVVLYDPRGAGADDGFAVTPWGLFWTPPDDEPTVVYWEELDLDDVALEEGVLTIEEVEVPIDESDRRLARELRRLIEAMVAWAQS